MSRIGIFGGSFDPVHIGHLWIAMAAVESLQLDQLLFVPAAQNPLKDHGPVAGDEERVEMLRLATSGNDQFAIDLRELDRAAQGKGPSYTVDTLNAMSVDYKNDDLYLVIGGDSLASFDRWKDPQQIASLAQLAAVKRGGEGPLNYEPLSTVVDSEVVAKTQQCEIEMPQIELSSTELRRRIKDGKSIRYRVPAGVEAMIASGQLYR